MQTGTNNHSTNSLLAPLNQFGSNQPVTFGRLAQGNDAGVVCTDTIEFISKRDLPPTSKVTYASFVCDIKPHKKETHRVRLVVGGDRLTYDDDAGSPAASLIETKILLNSVISDAKHGSQFMTCDLKDFYLATPMANPEYMRIALTSVPQDIIRRYNLHTLATPSQQIYIKIKKGMYGLKQAAVLAYNHLVANLSTHGYHPIPHTVGLWKHHTRRITFCLCVDDFGVKNTLTAKTPIIYYLPLITTTKPPQTGQGPSSAVSTSAGTTPTITSMSPCRLISPPSFRNSPTLPASHNTPHTQRHHLHLPYPVTANMPHRRTPHPH